LSAVTVATVGVGEVTVDVGEVTVDASSLEAVPWELSSETICSSDWVEAV
jgi:hypothetical protein